MADFVKLSLTYRFYIHKKKWVQVGLWWAYPRDIYGTSSAEVSIVFLIG